MLSTTPWGGKEMASSGAADTNGARASAGIPDSIAAAWGVRERPHKGPKPALSLPRIVDAAARIAHTEGLNAVSRGRAPAVLVAAPMALYRHLSARDDVPE